jgi:hypothetical protein
MRVEHRTWNRAIFELSHRKERDSSVLRTTRAADPKGGGARYPKSKS